MRANSGRRGTKKTTQAAITGIANTIHLLSNVPSSTHFLICLANMRTKIDALTLISKPTMIGSVKFSTIAE